MSATRLAILESRNGKSAVLLLRRRVAFFRQRNLAQVRILAEHMRDMHREARVRRADVLQLVMDHAGGGENRKLAGKGVEQNQRQRDEEDDRRQPHQQVGHDQAVANFPETAAER